MAMEKLTVLQFTVLSAIVDACIKEGWEFDLAKVHVYTPDFDKNQHEAFLELQFKGLVGEYVNIANRSICWLTEKGYSAYRNCDKSYLN